MRRYIFILTASVVVASCKSDRYIDISDLNEPDKVVINCFPTTNGYTEVFVSKSRKRTEEDTGVFNKPNVVSLGYDVNGKRQSVRRLEGKRVFYATDYKQETGDRVRVTVQAEEMPGVWAETTIPEAVPIEKISAEVKGTGMYKTNQLAITLKDPAGEGNHYAVQVVENFITKCSYEYDKEGGVIKTDKPDTLSFLCNVETQYEPLLSGMNFANLLLNEGSMNFLHRFYIFSDESIDGKTYTMNLRINANFSGIPIYRNEGKYYNTDIKEEDVTRHSFFVTLFSITPEFYNFMKSLNDLYDNELGEAGISVMMPIYTNVNGGLGIVAGYNTSRKEIILKGHE